MSQSQNPRCRHWSAPLAAGLIALTTGAAAHADLFGYVQRPDPSFAWKQRDNHDTPAGKIVEIQLTSQTWREIPWHHQLRVYVPKEVKYPKQMLLFISGGSTTSQADAEDHAMGLGLAELCGARVAVLPQVPNQPLLGGKKEDDLIGETFMIYLKTQDPDAPLLLPMVKSAVAAMDALQAWGKEQGHPVEEFVVTGASKRGWTTWLTGAVESGKRVIAIAPMVIPTLNMRAQTRHQLEVWGEYSEQIEDYTRRGLTELFDTPIGRKLWTLVDPYTYLDRIKIPVLQINGTNDRYWTLDSMNLYWDDIQAPKYVVYLPNAGHGLDQHRDYAIHGIAALFRHAASGREMPKITWKPVQNPDGSITLNVSAPDAKAVKFWAVRSDSRDYRESRWEPLDKAAVEAGNPIGNWSATLAPEGRNAAILGDLTFEADGLEYHLSTEIYEVLARPIAK